MKRLKRITAGLLATTMAIGMMCMSASAATGSLDMQSYSSRYIGGGAPGSSSYTDTCELYATNAGYYGYCSTLDISGTSGKVTIKCSNYSSGSLEITQSGKGGQLSISGTLNSNAKFPCSCYGNNSVYSTGYVKTGTTPA
ncbi:MAG: hypothetical protein K2I33_01905 [Oscillospiraceae bacterium]|nr:hypothetical protein [Oscillospiraceae bacterium]